MICLMCWCVIIIMVLNKKLFLFMCNIGKVVILLMGVFKGWFLSIIVCSILVCVIIV